MLEYLSQFCNTLESYPMIVAIISNLILCGVFLCSIWLPHRLSRESLEKIQKKIDGKGFNKLLIDQILLICFRVVLVLLISTSGILLATRCLVSPGIAHFIPIIITFSAVTVFSKSLIDSHLINEKKLPPYWLLYRISAVSFLIVATFSVLSVQFPPHIVHGFSLLTLFYYCMEMYANRKTFTKCFVLQKPKEDFNSLSIIESISEKFVFISLVCMGIIVLLNYHRNVPLDEVLYRNVLGMYRVFFGMFAVQAIVVFIENQFITEYENLCKRKTSQKSFKQRRRNWQWFCDLFVILYYAVSLGIGAFTLFDVNILNFLIVDKSIIICLIILSSYVIYCAFDAYTGAYVDEADPADRDKILTFMPIVKVMFNILLFFLSGLSVLAQLGIPIGPFLASFAAVGAAVALAAQDLVKGFLHGIILLIENNFYMGDFVTINGQGGIVVKISTRTLTLRDFNGDEYSIPYNTIGVIINHSREYYVHSEKLLVSPHADIKKVGNLLIEVVQKMKTEREFADKILEDAKIKGIQTFSDDGLRICWSLKTSPKGRLLHLEIYRRLFPLLREEGIPIPYKHTDGLLMEKE